ncbi:MAG: hypothetical protein ACREOE_05210, partial [Gemmatimonadales bacterium]
MTAVVQAVPALQVPLAWHDSRLVPEHSVCPGAQDPVHTPEMHVWLLQATGAPHWPAEEQVWTPLPEHCTAPGVHTPEQTPDWHVDGDTQWVPQPPQLLLSVCSLTHAPLHAV